MPVFLVVQSPGNETTDTILLPRTGVLISPVIESDFLDR